MQVAGNKQCLDGSAAASTRELLRERGVVSVSLVGTPGSGKTSLIETTVRRLGGRYRVGAVVANPAAGRDVTRIARWTAQVQAVNTVNLTAEQAAQAVHAMELSEIDVLLLEQVGRLEGEPRDHLGEDASVAIFSVTGGDDKAAEYANRLRGTDAVLLTKIDLLPYVEFSREIFRRDVARINSHAPLMEISCKTLHGVSAWLDWLSAWLFERKFSREQSVTGVTPEWFFG